MFIYILIVSIFLIGYFIGSARGKAEAHEQFMNNQKQMEANQMWMDLMKKMGVKNEQ
jgi:hypothetical protein